MAGTPPRLDALCAAHVIQYTKSKSVYRLAARYEIKRRRWAQPGRLKFPDILSTWPANSTLPRGCNINRNRAAARVKTFIGVDQPRSSPSLLWRIVTTLDILILPRRRNFRRKNQQVPLLLSILVPKEGFRAVFGINVHDYKIVERMILIRIVLFAIRWFFFFSQWYRYN